MGAENRGYGVDFNHLELNGFGLLLNDFIIDGSDVRANIEGLRFSEKSGLELSDMSTKLHVSNQQIKLSSLKLSTKQSVIDIPLFELNYNQWSAFRDFEDSVDFNSILNDAQVALNEVSYFVPSMQGMTDTVSLKGRVMNSVNNLEISELELLFGKKSLIKGDFQLPDFSTGANEIVSQHISSAFIDLQDVKELVLPIGISPLPITSILKHKFISFTDLNLKGNLNQMSIDALAIESNYGKLQLKEQMILKNEKTGLSIFPAEELVSPVIINEFKLGSFLKQEDLGIVVGSFRPTFRRSNSGEIEVDINKGSVSRFDINDYQLSGIFVDGSSIKNQSLDLQLTIKEAAVDLELFTELDLLSPNYKGDIQVNRLDLDALNYTQDTSVFIGNIHFDLNGKTDLNWGGHVLCDDLAYFRGVDSLKTTHVDLGVFSEG